MVLNLVSYSEETGHHRDDPSRFRKNVLCALVDLSGRILVCQRIDRPEVWQLPQGGLQPPESEETAALRELEEEVGLPSSRVRILGQTEGYRSYLFPSNGPRLEGYAGQVQRGFLIQALDSRPEIALNPKDQPPEFSASAWVSYYHPIALARTSPKLWVYRETLLELAKFLPARAVSLLSA